MNEQGTQQVAHTMVVGVNHETSSVELRDQLLFNDEKACHYEQELLASPEIHEAVVISTCNRSEVYVIVRDPMRARDVVEEAWGALFGVDPALIRKHAYCYMHADAIRHLYRVAASLDSLVVGESQIFGQIKSAFQRSRDNQSVSFYFNYLFQAAIRTGKRVRSETSVNEGAVSISFAAMELARKVLGRLDQRTIGIIGSGEMGALAAENMKNKADAKRFIFFNRSTTRAKDLADKFGGDVCLLEDIENRLHECDVVVSATGAADIVVTRPVVEAAMKKRRSRSLFLIDIAAPRDIAPDVGEVYNTFLFTIDDLKEAVEENLARRQDASRAANEIVSEEVGLAEAWFRSLEVRPLIGQIRSRYDTMVEDVLRENRNGASEEEHARLEQACRAMMARFLHQPLTELKLLGEQGEGPDAAYIARRLFDLPAASNSEENQSDENV